MFWRIGVKRKQKEAVSRLQKDFPACGPRITPICIFKRSAGRILSTPALSGRNILVIDIIFPRSDRFFRQERKLLTDLIRGGAKLGHNR